MTRLDENEIYRWWETFKRESPLVEIRLIGTNKTGSGYFKDPKTIVNAIAPYTSEYNVYYTVNPVAESCYGREQQDKIVLKPKNTTSDAEIEGREWVFIDIDCKRIAGVNATDEEVGFAKNKANQVYRFLLDQGFYKPVVVFSGSGVHLYLKCELENSEERSALIKRFLLALGSIFDDEHVNIDSVVYNAGRIARLPGTYSCKGSSRDKNRPQRLCHLVSVPTELRRNDLALFEKVAALCPEEEKKTRPGREYNYSTERFDLEDFMKRHGIEVKKKVDIPEGTRYILKQCVFDPAHGSDAMIFQWKSGALQYYCFHNGCRDRSWRDVRDLFEPERNTRDGYRWRNGYVPAEKPAFVPVKETETLGKKWLDMEDIEMYDARKEESIHTGYSGLDSATGGLIFGETTVLSGINSSGKSSWLNQVALNAVQSGFKVAIWSGELVAKKLKNWIYLVAAGRNNVEPVKGYDGLYFVPSRIAQLIDVWLRGNFFLYNNDYGQKWEQLYADIDEQVEKTGVRLVVLDNLMSLDLGGYQGDKNEKQHAFISDVTNMAKKRNIHVILVAHPRKVVTFLRKEDISGSSDLTNLADNVFIVHRVNKDFERRASDYLSGDVINDCIGYDNIVEVCKNRSRGAVDYIQGMYFERETKRFLNAAYEYTIYGWQKPLTLDFPEDSTNF